MQAPTESPTLSPTRPSRRYQYEPLADPRTYIRILTVHAPGDDGLLQCELCSFSLESKPFYIALSYEWADPNAEGEIRLHGKVHTLRHNLFLFLQHLWEKKKKLVQNKQLRLWADAICIDQTNLKEKGSQVSSMGRIFNQADAVFAWLGWTSSRYSRLAFSHIRSLPAHLTGLNESLMQSHIPGSRPVLDKQFFVQEYSNNYSMLKELKLIIRLLVLPYWSRRRIVQEILLAREVTLMSDTEELPWFDLQVFFGCINGLRNLVSLKRGTLYDEMMETIDTIRKTNPFTMWRWMNSRQGGTFRTKVLSSLLRQFRPTICQVEYDRVYSLLSLVPDGYDIPTDYECSMSELLGRLHSPFRPRYFGAGRLLTLAMELGLKLSTGPKQGVDGSGQLYYISCHFPVGEVDQVMISTSYKSEFEDFFEEVKDLIAVHETSFKKLYFSYVKQAASLQLMESNETRSVTKHLPLSQVTSQSWTWGLSTRGYLVHCSPRTRPGDFLLPLTREYCLIVHLLRKSPKIVGHAYRFSLQIRPQDVCIPSLDCRLRSRDRRWSNFTHTEYTRPVEQVPYMHTPVGRLASFDLCLEVWEALEIAQGMRELRKRRNVIVSIQRHKSAGSQHKLGELSIDSIEKSRERIINNVRMRREARKEMLEASRYLLQTHPLTANNGRNDGLRLQSISRSPSVLVADPGSALHHQLCNFFDVSLGETYNPWSKVEEWTLYLDGRNLRMRKIGTLTLTARQYHDMVPGDEWPQSFRNIFRDQRGLSIRIIFASILSCRTKGLLLCYYSRLVRPRKFRGSLFAKTPAGVAWANIVPETTNS